MKALLLKELSRGPWTDGPLQPATVPDPSPGKGEILVRVTACGVCHTELDEIEGRTPPPSLPVIPGHEVIGRVAATGPGVERFDAGDRVGVGWIYAACGNCRWCRRGEENLCPDFRGTGRDADGGYAELMVVPAAFAAPVPDAFADAEAAPLLCAGAIGYRSLRLSGAGSNATVGLTGFGASAHLVLAMVRGKYPGATVYVFARNPDQRAFALQRGAAWAGATEDAPPAKPDCIIDTTPAWKPVVAALKNLAPGGRLVINAIRKEGSDAGELARIDYAAHLWEEKEVKSVANVTRRDITAFLELAAELDIRPDVTTYPLAEANRALNELKTGGGRGAKVLLPG